MFQCVGDRRREPKAGRSSGFVLVNALARLSAVLTAPALEGARRSADASSFGIAKDEAARHSLRGRHHYAALHVGVKAANVINRFRLLHDDAA